MTKTTTPTGERRKLKPGEKPGAERWLGQLEAHLREAGHAIMAATSCVEVHFGETDSRVAGPIIARVRRIGDELEDMLHADDSILDRLGYEIRETRPR